LHHRISPVAQKRLVIKTFWVNKVKPKLWVISSRSLTKHPPFGRQGADITHITIFTQLSWPIIGNQDNR
jgi:hypothetical protein